MSTPRSAFDAAPPAAPPKSSRGPLIGAGVFLVVLALAAAGFLVLKGRDSSERAAMQVTLRALSDQPDDAFATGKIKVPEATLIAFANTSRTSTAGGTISGDKAELYGASQGGDLVDREALAESLTADDAKTEAWARSYGIAPGEVAATVQTLTPLVLTGDTMLVEYGYADHAPTTHQVVLQRGTVVLVDAYGAPRVRALSGGPLAPAEASTDAVTYVGDQWEHFADTSIRQIEPARKPLAALEAVDLETDASHVVTLGSSVRLDGYLVADDQGVHVISRNDGTRTTVIDHPVARAVDDGVGGIIYQELRPLPTGQLGGWTFDVRRSPPDEKAQAAIWHLPAGQDEPVELIAPDDPDAEWYAVEAVGHLGDARVLVYSTASVVADADPQGTGRPTKLEVLDLDTDEVREVGSDLTGDSYLGAVGLTGDAIGYATSDGETYETTWHFFDPDLVAIDNRCTATADGPCPFRGQMTERGTIVAMVGSETGESIVGIDIVGISDSSDDRTIEGVGGDYLIDAPFRVTFDAFGDESVVSYRSFETPPSDGVTNEHVDLATGEVRRLDFNGEVWILRAPLVRPDGDAAPTGDTPATTKPPTTTQAQAPSWDEFANASIPAVCAHPPTTLVDGVNPDLGDNIGSDPKQPPYVGYYQLERSLTGGGSTDEPGYVAGLPSEIGPLTVVVVNCNAGGVSWPNDIAAFGTGGTFYDETSLTGHLVGDNYETVQHLDEAVPLWSAAGFDGPARGGVWRLQLEGDQLIVYTAAINPGEPGCCSTGFARVTMHAADGQLHIDAVEPDGGP